MVGWRRAFCTSIPRDQNRRPPPVSATTEKANNGGDSNPSPRFGAKFGFFSSNSNPSTPRLNTEPTPSPTLRCRTAAPPETGASTAKLQCKTPAAAKSPRFFSNPSSPRSPSTFSLLKSTLRISKVQSRCGICLQSVKTGQGMAIFTAECSHSFHPPCISARVNENANLVCPVCSSCGDEAPLIPSRGNQKYPNHAAMDPPKTKKTDSVAKKGVKQHELKVYNDDEPLMSPTTGARFNPIPESDENDDEEFQGFFVSATPPSSMNRAAGELLPVQAKLSPEAAVVTAGRNSETYAVVLKVRAPATPDGSSFQNPARRAPIDLVTVLDVGGSVTKLQALKRAMRLVITSLCSTDRLSIVAFSATSKRLLPLRRMTNTGRRSARRIVDGLSAGLGASAGDAIKKAAKVLEDRRERNSAASIILLSEGHGDALPRSRSSPVVSSTRLTHMEIPVHMVKLGDGGAFGLDAAADGDAFGKCIGSLLSVVVQDVRIEVGPHFGSDPLEIPAVYPCAGRPTVSGPGLVRLGDLYADEERELLVELKATSAVGSHHVLSVRCSYRNPTSQEPIYGEEQALLVPRPQAVRSSAASPSIERLRNLFVSTRALAESRRLSERNDLSGAQRLLSSARELLAQQSAAEFVRGLDSELAEIQRRRLRQVQVQRTRASAERGFDDRAEPLTPTSAWRAAERLAKVAIMRKSMNRVSDLHGFENARF